MARSIDWYLDTIKKRNMYASDREIGRRVGFKGAPVTYWRTKRCFPAAETMVKLAELAGVDPKEALGDLWSWSLPEPARTHALELVDCWRREKSEEDEHALETRGKTYALDRLVSRRN